MDKRPQLVALGKKPHGLFFPLCHVAFDQVQAIRFKHKEATVDVSTVTWRLFGKSSHRLAIKG
tara:strand:+ start:312 stop:500 length:189 start_codon:yes stop_codon:yes gene_type:complete